MTARPVPPIPNWFAGQKMTATLLNQIATWQQFWDDPPMFRMYQAGTQSPANNTWTQITMDSLEYDTDSGRAGGTPWSYTIPAGMTGRWCFEACVSWSANATGPRLTAIYKNGSQINGANFTGVGTAAAQTNVFGSVKVAANAGDVISVWGFQGSGGGLATNVGSSGSYFEGELLSLASP